MGLAFEFSDDQSDQILSYLRKHEGKDFTMETGTVQLYDGSSVTARIPTNDRRAATYIGHKTIAERAAMARIASGTAGKSIDYVASIRQELHQRGIDDPDVEEFWRILCAGG